jgi:hypothetical protein
MARKAKVEGKPAAAQTDTAGNERTVNHEEIAARAYEIYQARGGSDGADFDDWLQAERELTQSRQSAA